MERREYKKGPLETHSFQHNFQQKTTYTYNKGPQLITAKVKDDQCNEWLLEYQATLLNLEAVKKAGQNQCKCSQGKH